MKKKIFIGSLVFFILIIGILFATPYLFKDQINDYIKNEIINKELKVSVDYDSYDLSIFKSFPDFRFTLNKLLVVGQEKFEGDTLAMMKELSIDLDVMKWYKKNEIQVNSVLIDELNLKAYILEDSTSSLDIMIEKPDEEVTKIDTSEESFLNTQIKSFIVKKSNILYDNKISKQIILVNNLNINSSANYKDEKIGIDGDSKIDEITYITDSAKNEIKLTDLNIDLNGDYYKEKLNFDTKASISNLQVNKTNQKINIDNLDMILVGDYLNSFINLDTKTTINSLDFQQGDTKYLKKANVSLEGKIDADLDKSSYTFNGNSLKINELIISYDGKVKMPNEDIDIDLKFATNKSTFKELISIIPEKYISDYKDMEVKGNFDLKGSTKGVYNDNSYPSFNIDMGIDNGYLKNSSLPTPIDKINFKANVKSPNSDLSNMDLDIPKMTFVIENEPIELSLKMLDILNDSYVDLKAKGKIDLEIVPKFYTIEDLNKLDGEVNMDVIFKGKLSDVDNKNFNKIDFQGFTKIKDLHYDTKSTAMPMKVKTMNIYFTPQYANMTDLDMTYGKSDIKGNGKLENVVNYVLSDGTIEGNLNIKSDKIDLIELMGEDESSSAKTSSSNVTTEATRVPKNIDFTTNSSIKELIYDDIVLTDVKGKIVLKNEQININSVTANMLGGKAKINGKYSTKKAGKPVIDFKYDINNFDIKQTFKYVNTVQQIAPIAQFLDGNFSSKFSFNSLLENDFTPNMSNLNGLGDVRIGYANFLNFPVFKSVSDAIKVPLLNIDKATIKNAWTVFKIKNGGVEVEPFDYAYQDIKMNISGSNKFDKTINYLMKVTVPSNKFGGAASVANDWLSKQNIPLLNLSVPKEITFHLNLSGLITKPKVKILKVTSDGSDKGVVEQVTDEIKDKAKEEAEKLKQQAEERAKKEAEKLKKQAEDQARKEADKLQKEVEDKLKKEAEDLLKDKLPNFGW